MKKITLIPLFCLMLCSLFSQSIELRETGCNSLSVEKFTDASFESLVLLETLVKKDTWIKYSSQFSSDSKVYFDDLKTGSYKVIYIDNLGRKSSNIVKLECIDSQENSMADLFTLSPNPAQELVELKIEHQIMEPLTCEIYSSNGILISTHDITESRVFINTENMIDGIYIVSLYEQNKMVGMSKLIIQKN